MSHTSLSEYQHKELKNQLKTIVEETNKICNTNFNLLTFDVLNSNSLLEIVKSVLIKLNVLPLFNENNTLTGDIFYGLKMICYEPKKLYSSEEFAEEISKGTHDVIYPILYWLLTNKNKVKKRAYLARYGKKLDIPPNLQSDLYFDALSMEYESLICKFWNTHKSCGEHKKEAKENEELKKDIELMKKDISNLTKKIDVQKEKIDVMPESEKYLLCAKKKCEEFTKISQLTKQKQEATCLINILNNQKEEMRKNLQQMQITRLKCLNPIEHLKEEMKIHNLVFLEKLPKELSEAKREQEICNKVIDGREDDNLELKIKDLSRQIDKLNINRTYQMASNNIECFKMQAEVMANQKRDLTNLICEYKNQISEIENAIADKNREMCEFVGGEVLYGQEFQDFVQELKTFSVTYKSFKKRINNLNSELCTLEKTLDILNDYYPDLNGLISESKRNDQIKQKSCSLEDLQSKCRLLTKEKLLKRSEASDLQVSYSNMIEHFESIKEYYEKNKSSFIEATGPILNEIEKIKATTESLELTIRNNQKKWDDVNKEIERDESIFMKLSEEFINNIGEEEIQTVTIKDVILTKLHKLEEKKEEINQRKESNKAIIASDKEQYSLLTNVFNIFQWKLNIS